MSRVCKMKISCTRLNEYAILPAFAHNSGDSGADLYSSETYYLPSKTHKLIRTGIAMAIPEGYGGFIWDRSGMALKHGLHVFGGVIDSSYRGELGVILFNSSETPYWVQRGDRIAQITFQNIIRPEFEEVLALDKSLRGEKGWGSTGR